LAGLLLVLLVLAGGAGTLWWAATHRAIDGQAARVGGTDAGSETNSPWIPTVVDGCSKVELDRERTTADGDNERCQRTPDLDPPQHWVEEPPGGFPKSNAAGPFPGEKCGINGDKDYSPVGDHVACAEGVWQIIA
jgi:hypothetical protein